MDKKAYFARGQEIVKRLNDLTYEAYFVGGVVRDYLMGVEFSDIDIATSATPEQLLLEFPNLDMRFASNGCCVLREGEFVYEINTFREETYLNRTRKPSQVHFSMNLREDVKRRDFTINALAMTENLDVVDLTNGQKDLKMKKIRFIGKPKKRIEEDPLRVLRAYELIARFGFHFTRGTKKAIKKMTHVLSLITDQKVQLSLQKIFNAPFGKRAIKQMIKLNSHAGLVDYSDGLEIIARKYKKLTIVEKFALCYKLGKKVPNDTTFDKDMHNFFKKVTEVAYVLEHEPITRLTVFNNDVGVLKTADKLNSYTIPKYKANQKLIEEYDRTMPIRTINDMVFKGYDVVNLAGGASGAFVGKIMNNLCERVIMREIANDYTILKREAKILLNNYRLQNQTFNSYDSVEVPKQEILEEKPNQIIDEPNFVPFESASKEDLLSLNEEYTELFDHIMSQKEEMINESTISDEEKTKALKEMAETIKKQLLDTNPEFKKLFKEE